MPVSSVGSGSFHDGSVQLLIEVPAAAAKAPGQTEYLWPSSRKGHGRVLCSPMTH